MELEPLLERATKREVAKGLQVGVQHHRRVLAVEKAGDGDPNSSDLVPLVGDPVEHVAQLAGNRVDQLRGDASRSGRNGAATEYSAVLAHDSDFGVGCADVDCASESHQRADAASSGFFQRSMGFTIPWGRNGSAIFFPTPAEAYAA